jgi:branched-chain amino acid transport system ATP-binding protein
MLTINNLSAAYAKIEVLKDISLKVDEGEIVCLIGANGAGKSTLLRVISGILSPRKGEIVFNGEQIGGGRPDHIVRIGISQVPEGRQIFSSLTVKQNLLLGTYAHKVKRGELQRLLSLVFDLFPVLEKKLSSKGGSLSGGEQQMLAIGRGIMSQPKILLLDEPSLGLAPLVVKSIFETIEQLRASGISILLVEQNAKSALQIGNRAYIMETGNIVKDGNTRDLLFDGDVRKRYLGA